MRLIQDPPSPIDPRRQTVRRALHQIRYEVEMVRREYPGWTSHECAREARRRCAGLVLDALGQPPAPNPRRR
jgi:hypothetical protein